MTHTLNKISGIFEWIPAIVKSEYFHELPLHYYVKDLHGTLVSCNNTLAKTIGLEKSSDLIGMNNNDLCPDPEDALVVKKNDDKIISLKKQCVFIEKVMLPFREEVKTYISYKMPLMNGKVKGLVGISFAVDETATEFSALSSLIKNQSITLSKRQLDCLFHLVKGHTVRQIATLLSLSAKTVEHYLETCKDKLNCLTKSELISAGLQLSVIRKRL